MSLARLAADNVGASDSDPINLRPQQEAFSGLGKIQISSIITAAISLILIVAAIIFFFMLVIGGIRWITSGGDKEQTTAARSQLTAALIGLVIVFSAWAIVSLVSQFFGGVNILDLTIPSIQ